MKYLWVKKKMMTGTRVIKVAIAISLSFYGEHLDTSGVAPVFELIGLGLVTAGVFAIAQTPLIAGLEEQPQH